MDDVVAVEITLRSGERRFFITWGRIQAPVDPGPLEELVLENCTRFDLGGEPVGARVCWSLQEARDQPYFFEALLEFANRDLQPGEDRGTWRKRVGDEMKEGRLLHYLGDPRKGPPND